jgi:hypothetical protein
VTSVNHSVRQRHGSRTVRDELSRPRTFVAFQRAVSRFALNVIVVDTVRVRRSSGRPPSAPLQRENAAELRRTRQAPRFIASL